MKKTDELRGTYATETEDSLSNARAMMRWDSEPPALEIEAPRKVTTRRGGKLLEEDRPAFVKIYTDFKKELKDIKGDDLKVWLYLALSVNRFTGEAEPGLRKIAGDTDLAVNTVQLCLERLEAKNLLDIHKKEGRRNSYRPSDYVSAKKATVSGNDTVPPTVSNSDTTVSKNGGTVSTRYRKSAQPEEPEELDILDGILRYQLKPKAIQDAIRECFKLTPNWEAKTNRQFLQWAIQEQVTPEQIKHAAGVWGRDKRFNWSHPNLKGIQEHWLQLVETLQPEPYVNDMSVIERILA